MTDLQALLEAGTPGPWQVSGGRQSSITLGRDAQVHHVGPDGDGVAAVYYDMKTGRGFADAKLIVAAVNALPGLLARIASLSEAEAGLLNTVAQAAKAHHQQDQRIRRLEAALRVSRGYVVPRKDYMPTEQASRDLKTIDAALGLHPDTGRRSGDVGGEG